MKSGQVRTHAVVVGSAAGAAVGVALLASAAAAYAADLPSPSDFSPPGYGSTPTNVIETDYGPYYSDIQEDIHQTIYGTYPDVVGSYDTHGHYVTTLFSEDDTTQVTDTTGAAPAVGTVWDYSDFHTLILYPDPAQWPWEQNYYEYDPSTGLTQDLFSFNWQSLGTFENYFSSGPDGTLDEFIVFNHVIPIFDFPAPSAAELAGAGDVGDFSTMWSDLAALF